MSNDTLKAGFKALLSLIWLITVLGIFGVFRSWESTVAGMPRFLIDWEFTQWILFGVITTAIWFLWLLWIRWKRGRE